MTFDNDYVFVFKISIINLLREILGFCPAEWVDDVDIVIESVNPNKYRDKFCLNKGYIYTEALEILPSLSSKRLVIFVYITHMRTQLIFKHVVLGSI